MGTTISSPDQHVDVPRFNLVGDEAAFAAALYTLSDRAVRDRFAAEARKAVAKIYGTWDDCAARYALVYDDLLKESRA